MLYFLLNPTSSSGNGERIWQQLEPILEKEAVSYECIRLSSPGEATEMTRRITSGEDAHTIVVVGGDGSLNECISGIVHFDRCTLGCIPTGSGNDFVRAMGMASDPETALKQILCPREICAVNIGETLCGDISSGGHAKPDVHRFLVSSGAGYDAAICHEVSRTGFKPFLNKLGLGKLVYTVTALKLLFSMKPLHMRIVTDENKTLTYKRAFFAVAMNTAYEGGGYRFCPDADPGDGYLDLMVVEGIRRPMVLFMMPLAAKGKHTNMRGIHLLRCKQATVRTDYACVHTDGEHAGFHHQITWKLRDEKLRVIVR